MGLSKKERHTTYKPMPYHKRFWFYSEYCYTEEDMSLRSSILEQRALSGLDKDYLNTQASWFLEDAFINIHEHSWIYSASLKPKQELARDDFFVKPIDTQRLQWPSLSDLMQNIGDYLLLRNKELPIAHLNQPMNYFFLDINSILKGLSQNPNIDQVKNQLVKLTHYVRTIEKKITPSMGSDRLFLANLRKTIEQKIEPQLTHLSQTRLLKDRLSELSKSLKQLSNQRNRILHFALNINPVNPHPYEFASDQIDASTHPTKAALQCAGHEFEISTSVITSFKLSKEDLVDCPHFKLISMDDGILTDYAQAISHQSELERFQYIITQINDLLGDAGEIYTLYQFQEQLTHLIKQIDVFIEESSGSINTLLDANTEAYHQAIQAEQDLSFWKKWVTSEKEKLKTFIKNQDILSQFPSSASDLKDSHKAIKTQMMEIMAHLVQKSNPERLLDGLAAKAISINSALCAMQKWIGGPEFLPTQIQEALPRQNRQEMNSESNSFPTLYASNTATFFSLKTSSTLFLCPPNSSQCLEPDHKVELPLANLNGSFLFLLPASIIMGLIALYYMYHTKQKEKAEYSHLSLIE